MNILRRLGPSPTLESSLLYSQKCHSSLGLSFPSYSVWHGVSCHQLWEGWHLQPGGLGGGNSSLKVKFSKELAKGWRTRTEWTGMTEKSTAQGPSTQPAAVPTVPTTGPQPHGPGAFTTLQDKDPPPTTGVLSLRNWQGMACFSSQSFLQ